MKYCENCGKQMKKEDSFCESCGNKEKIKTNNTKITELDILKEINKNIKSIEDKVRFFTNMFILWSIVCVILFFIINFCK